MITRAQTTPGRASDWRDQAVCAGQRGFDSQPIEDQKAACQGCPVRMPCLEFALATEKLDGNDQMGWPVYGGLDRRERLSMRRSRTRQRPATIADLGPVQAITTSQVARMLGVTQTTVRRWADAGLLTCTRTKAGHRRFDPDEPGNAVREGRIQPSGEHLGITAAEAGRRLGVPAWRVLRWIRDGRLAAHPGPRRGAVSIKLIMPTDIDEALHTGRIKVAA